MNLPSEAELLRIFVGESDQHGGRPLYEAIVEEARRRGMAGATVLRGTLGFGARARTPPRLSSRPHLTRGCRLPDAAVWSRA